MDKTICTFCHRGVTYEVIEEKTNSSDFPQNAMYFRSTDSQAVLDLKINAYLASSNWKCTTIKPEQMKEIQAVDRNRRHSQ